MFAANKLFTLHGEQMAILFFQYLAVFLVCEYCLVVFSFKIQPGMKKYSWLPTKSCLDSGSILSSDFSAVSSKN